jgi:hypothetical protein
MEVQKPVFTEDFNNANLYTVSYSNGGLMDNMSNNIGEIALALSLAQSELDSAKKDSSGYGYNYSDLASVISTSKPVLAKHGLAVTQLLGKIVEGNVTLTTMLTHKSGQYFKSVSSIPLIEMKGTNAAQNAGASISYLRRYAYQAILGMASEDNDASSQGFKKESKPAASKTSSGDSAELKKKSSFRRSVKKTETVSTDEEL